jgi:hypothetical protein
MTEEERWQYICDLEATLLKGGVLVQSEWSIFIAKEATTAFAKGAFLACILTTVAAIETYLRSEAAADGKIPFFDLINTSDMNSRLKYDLHELRKYRNKWVHVQDPFDDQEIMQNPELYEAELEKKATAATRSLMEVLFSVQGV